MIEPRKLHTCSLVETQSGIKKIVVVGGSTFVPMASVEIFNISSNAWVKGERMINLCTYSDDLRSI